MQLQNKYHLAVLSAFALGMHGFESLLPSPIPWLKIGLANIITLITLILYGLQSAMIVTLIRVTLASLITGTFLGPAFMLSFSGGVASTLAMGAVFSFSPRLFSTIGLSVIGALFHNITQLCLAYFLFVQRLEAILIITPVIVLIGTITGTANGLISEIIIQNLKKNSEKVQNMLQS
jgi:heptaprenyl diphosphate synthase